ncbi:MAG TPA: M20/M25/M40 family metallo-hydrolase, partial [Vicinamibacterales bacterium]|nr:M20/M25/M40 family metallo-hydrolase [Vicinamibacterales bacterium]
ARQRASDPAWLDAYRPNVQKLIAAAQSDQFAWDRLAELTDTYGQRLSGSDNLARAIVWAQAAMKRDGLENVHTERVMVPRWLRGNESLEITNPPHHVIPMLGLGGSVATPAGGIEADVVVVSSGDELNKRAAEVKGKIVLFNVPYTDYGATVPYRSGGASMAARHGAVASLVRSVGPMGLRTTHTGNMSYADGVTRIPAAAIAAEDANRIQRLVNRGINVRVRLKMEAKFEADAESFNVIGEIRGSEKPEEIVLAGCHFDSWDPGTGASDDAVGCIVTWEAARLMKKLNIRPKRTVRIVLFTNEENGLRGGNGYRDAHAAEAARHVLAVESDSGVFHPARLGFTGSDAARKIIGEIATLLEPLGLAEVTGGGGGADIGPIATLGKVPMLAYGGDATKYFTIHHTPADTVERIDPKEVSTAAAALTTVIYVVADMPQPLPK